MATTTPATPSSSAPARVLTDASLLRLLASFQHGVPWAAVPLLRRYRADGRVTFDLAQGTFSSALQDYHALDEWAVYTMSEAIVFYGDFDALHTVWRQWGSTHGTPHDRVLLHGRLCEAACAFGRLDMLQWLYDTQRDVAVETPRTSINVYTSTVHGQLHVLEWLVERFPEHTRAVLRAVNCTEVVRGGHAAMLRWLLPRQLGRFPPDAMNIACEHGHLEVLQLLIAFTLMMPQALLDMLLGKAAVAGHTRVVEWLATDKHARYNMQLVTRVLGCGHVDVADFLLTQRHAYTRPIEGALDALTIELVLQTNQLQVLAFLIRVRDREKLSLSVLACTRVRHSLEALKLLLPISSNADIMRTLVELSIHANNGDSVACLLDHHSFPGPVVAFVERNEGHALGALPALICTATKGGDASAPSYLAQSAELARAAADATAPDWADAMLVASLASEPTLFEWLLRFDQQRVSVQAAKGDAKNVHVTAELLEICEQLRCGADAVAHAARHETQP